jgi:hypothetical protein
LGIWLAMAEALTCSSTTPNYSSLQSVLGRPPCCQVCVFVFSCLCCFFFFFFPCRLSFSSCVCVCVCVSMSYAKSEGG